MKKYITVILAMILSAGAFMPTTEIHAKDKSNNDFTNQIIEDDQSDAVDLIEKDMAQKNTSVLNELNKMEKNYTVALTNAKTSDDKDAITNMLNEINDMKQTYALRQRGIQLYGKASYEASVTACITYFNMNGYKLAAELLAHAKQNKKVDSTYKPSSYALTSITQSSVFLQLRTVKKTKGSSTFPKKGRVADIDCYYAIHKFSYTKPSTTSRQVTIKDRYDYDSSSGYQGITGVAVGAMYEAQQAGFIKPFKLSMTFK